MNKAVNLFLPCLADLFYPSIGRASIRVLNKAGLKVSYPENQTCCGQWAYNLGHHDAARKMAKHFISVFEAASVVVCPSGSCVMTVTHHYPELFKDDNSWKDRALAVAARTWELTDYLVNKLEKTDLGSQYKGKATLHDSCHPLRGLGIKDEPRLLLNNVHELELVEMDDPEVCCGFGGAFMAEYAPLSNSMAGEKVDQALATGADYLVMTEPGCLLNVDSALKDRNVSMKAVHIVEILAGE